MINAEGSATQVNDTPTVDLTIAGSGTDADPYILSAAVKISATAGNLVTALADGLAVTCESIQDCIGTALGDGLVYDDAANTISAQISADPGNTTIIGGDGGLFTPAAASAITANDSPTIDHTLTGTGALGDPYVLTSAVILDPVAGQLITAGPNGLLVSCEAVQDCVGNAFGPGLLYDDVGNQFRARISTDPGNSVSLGGDNGLFVPPGGAATITANDTPCINLSGDGSGATPLTAAPIIDPAAGNILSCEPTGLRADVAVGPCGVTGTGAPASPIVANVGVWPFPCDINAFASDVYCNAAGQLVAEPSTVFNNTLTDSANQVFAPTAVPVAQTVIVGRVLNVPNPSTCKPALLITETEVDVDFTLPVGAGATYHMNGDAMWRDENRGTATQTAIHTQTTKTFFAAALIPPGGNVNATLDVALSGGSGGAQYTRIQTVLRALVIAF